MTGSGTSLGLVLSCAHRWRSLTIRAGIVSIGSLMCDLRGVFLPRLKRIHFLSYVYDDAEFFVADNIPVLERLELLNCRPAVTLLPSFEKLTTLALSGQILNWELVPKSVHLPWLRSLTLDIDCSDRLMTAIIVPGLSHFETSLRYVCSPFVEVPLVFNEVHHLCFCPPIHCSVLAGIPQCTAL